MKSIGVWLALPVLLGSGGAVLAQGAGSIMVGGTYECSGSKRIVESCGPEYCQVQILNAYAPDGKGAKIEIYRSSIATQFAQCSVAGGVAVPTDPKAGGGAQARPQAQATVAARPATAVNPAYIAGAGAGVKMAQAGPAAASAKRLVPAAYHCSAFMGVPPNGHLQTMPGFTLEAGGRYRHQDGSTGTTTIEGETLVFHGGSLDKQAATFDAGPTGRGTVHLYNERRSRTVIDCEG